MWPQNKRVDHGSNDISYSLLEQNDSNPMMPDDVDDLRLNQIRTSSSRRSHFNIFNVGIFILYLLWFSFTITFQWIQYNKVLDLNSYETCMVHPAAVSVNFCKVSIPNTEEFNLLHFLSIRKYVFFHFWWFFCVCLQFLQQKMNQSHSLELEINETNKLGSWFSLC